MKTIKFEGASDDTFGSRLDDYDNSASGEPIVWRLSAGGESVLVWGQYAPAKARSGGWVIGICPDNYDDDDIEIPEWPMRFERSGREYSARLVIECPDDVTQSLVYPEERP